MAEPTKLEKALIALGRPTGNGIDAPDYRPLEDSRFDELLADKVEATSTDEILRVPGVYEELREYFNNDILEAWEQEHEGLAYPGRYQVLVVDADEAPRWDCCFDNPREAETELYRLIRSQDPIEGGLVYDARRRAIEVYAGSLSSRELDWALQWADPKPPRL
jgi:hypothetical protein